MKLLSLLGFVTVLCYVNGDHFTIGNYLSGVKLAHRTLVEYNAIPFMKRVKFFFYNVPDNQKIQGIQALDTLHSKASINITAGGVGYSYVNLRMKSERGSGLAYDIGIYVQDTYLQG